MLGFAFGAVRTYAGLCLLKRVQHSLQESAGIEPRTTVMILSGMLLGFPGQVPTYWKIVRKLVPEPKPRLSK